MSTLNEVIDQLNDQLEKNLQHTATEFSRIRAGKASPAMLDSVMVEYYGALTPLAQVANVNTPDSRTLAIQPWDKSLIRPIETAIINSNLGFFLQMTPFLLTIIALVLGSRAAARKRLGSPAALGLPYVRGERGH